MNALTRDLIEPACVHRRSCATAQAEMHAVFLGSRGLIHFGDDSAGLRAHTTTRGEVTGREDAVQARPDRARAVVAWSRAR
jgi:hypothetical protein